MDITFSLVKHNLHCHRSVLVLLSVVAMFFSTCIITDNWSDIMLTLVFGGFLSAVVEFYMCFARRRISRTKGHLFTTLLHSAVIADSLWFYLSDTWSVSVIIGQFAAIAAALLLIPVATFRRYKDDIAHQNFLSRWLGNLLVSGLFWAIVAALLFAWVYGIFTLCDATDTPAFTKTFECLGVWALFFGTSFYILVRPTISRKPNFKPTLAKVFIIIFTLYVLSLYANLFVCIFNWELPNGGVTWLTCIMMATLYLSWSLYYPFIKTNATTKKERTLQKQLVMLPLVTLPLIIFLSVAIGRRIADYGITANRLFVLLLNVWFYAIVAFMTLSTKKGKPLTGITTSFIILLIISCCAPVVNIYSLTEKIITRQVNNIISQYDTNTSWPKNNDEFSDWLRTLPDKEADKLHSKIFYLQSQYKKEVSGPWCTEYLSFARDIDVTTNTHDDSNNTTRRLLVRFSSTAKANQKLAETIPPGNWDGVYTERYLTINFEGTCHKYYNPKDDSYHLPFSYNDVGGTTIDDTLLLPEEIDSFISNDRLIVPMESGAVAVLNDVTLNLITSHDTSDNTDIDLPVQHLQLYLESIKIYIPTKE